jgi:Lrp/AsnC family transcriptional regulator for asnA, asnC and gidA
MSTPQLDETDYHIIAELRNDGRQPYAAVARKVGLPVHVVRTRVARLLAARAIRITIITNVAELGYLTGTIRMHVPHNRIHEVAQHLVAIPEVDYVLLTTGPWNLVTYVVCVDLDQFSGVVRRRIAPIDGIDSMDVSLDLQVVKNALAW